MGVARGLAAARATTPPGRSRPPRDLFAQGRPSEPDDQDSRDAEGLPAIEEAIFAGIPINVTLLFSREHYFAAAEAFLRGIERRIDAGLKPDVASVASVFVSRWDSAVAAPCPTHCATSSASPWPSAPTRRTGRCSARRAGSASTMPAPGRSGSCGPAPAPRTQKASDVLYIKALAAPFTVNTIPEATLNALADHGDLTGLLPADGGDCEEVLAQFASAGVDVQALAARLQTDGAASFVKSWHSLMAVIASKSAAAHVDASAGSIVTWRGPLRAGFKSGVTIAETARSIPMTIGTVPAAGSGRLTEQPAWKALEAHHRTSAPCTSASCSRAIRDAANG